MKIVKQGDLKELRRLLIAVEENADTLVIRK